MSENVQGLIAEAQRIADLCPRSDASAAFMGLITALEATEAERDAAAIIIDTYAGMKAAAWDEGVEYAKSQLREMCEDAEKPLAGETRPIQNAQVQPCRDAMDASDGRWGYREYDAHIATVRLDGAMDLLTVSAGVEGYEDDDDPNPYRTTDTNRAGA